MKAINVINRVCSEGHWRIEGASFEFSHHMYRNSPFETCNSCGNCDGASCDICHKVQIDAHIECSMGSDELYKWLLEESVPEDTASDLAYSDYCGYTRNGYRLVWPTEDMLKEQYPELHKTITTLDEEVLVVIESFRGQFDCFADLSKAVLKHYGFVWYSSSGHVRNQLDLYWNSCNQDHDIACK